MSFLYTVSNRRDTDQRRKQLTNHKPLRLWKLLKFYVYDGYILFGYTRASCDETRGRIADRVRSVRSATGIFYARVSIEGEFPRKSTYHEIRAFCVARVLHFFACCRFQRMENDTAGDVGGRSFPRFLNEQKETNNKIALVFLRFL